MLAPQHNAISRRTVAKGVAWATPVVMIAGAAPAFAASRVCNYSVSFSAAAEQRAERQLTATSHEGNEITVTMTQATKFSGVASGSNMSIGTARSTNDNQCQFTSAGTFPATGLVLNHKGDCKGTAASQTVSFTFSNADGPVSPTGGSITITGIGSADTSHGWARYQDQVTFDSPASSPNSGLTSEAGGTKWYASGTTNTDEQASHTFTFNQLPTSLTFTSLEGGGSQAISITGFQFQAPC